MKTSKKIITICSSASFYKDVLDITDQLKKSGYIVKIPKIALTMRKNNDFNVDHYKTWFKDKNAFKIKKSLMDAHFKKVTEADAILVVNEEKKGLRGYIGGNVLMEMTLAYYHKKPIFIWDMTDKKSSLYEEIIGINPIFINKNLNNIKL